MPDRLWLAATPADVPPEAAGARRLLLAKDYMTLLRWRRAADGAELLQTAGPLAAAAAELRRPFLDLIAELGTREASPAWWASRVSERNTAVSPLFLHIAWLRLAERALDVDGALVVVADEPAVLTALDQVARARGWSVSGAPLPSADRRAVAAALRRAFAWVGHALARRLLAPPVRGVPDVLIRSFVDEATLSAPAYRDRYFPGLAPWLRGQGLSVATVPVLALGPLGYRKAWSRLAAFQEPFLSFDRLVRVRDLVWALRQAGRAARMPGQVPDLDGLKVGELFAAERRRTAFEFGTLDALVAARVPLRLREAGVQPSLVILEYENMILEKPLLLGLREHQPDARLVGYQHGALYPLLLCNFVTGKEARYAPLPDRVVCNGPAFRDILVGEGLPEERAVAGPALRYAYLREPPAPEAAPAPIVFVPLPLMRAQGVELVHKILQGLAGLPGVQVALKPHPMGSIDPLLRDLGIDALPEGFEIVAGAVSEWLPRAAATVGLASSTLYEAVAAGVPVVIVGQDAVLDLDPLGWEPDLAPTARSPSELRQRVEEALAMDDAARNDVRARGRDLLDRSFGPVDDTTLQVFLDELPHRLPGR